MPPFNFNCIQAPEVTEKNDTPSFNYMDQDAIYSIY